MAEDFKKLAQDRSKELQEMRERNQEHEKLTDAEINQV